MTMVAIDTNRDLSKIKTPELQRLLRECLTHAVSGIIEAARIVKEIDDRGEDSDLEPQALGYLRRIANGQLLPELALNWQHTAVYNRARMLPLPVQKTVVSNEPIRVVCLKDGGKVDAWLCEPRNMTGAIVRQVFAPDHIRSEAEQIAWIRGAQAQAAQEAPEKKPAVVPYVIKGSNVEFTEPCRLTKKQLQALLKAMG